MLTDIRVLADHFLIALPNINELQYKIQSNLKNTDFQKLPPFQFESLIQIYLESWEVIKMKVVELIKMNNFYFGSFSSSWEKSKVILEFLFCPNSNHFWPQIEILNFKMFASNSSLSIQNQLWILKDVL